MENTLTLTVEDVTTGEKREGVALPLTDPLVVAVLGAEEQVMSKALEFVRSHGRRLARLHRDGVTTRDEMDSGIIGIVTGLNFHQEFSAVDLAEITNAALNAATVLLETK